MTRIAILATLACLAPPGLAGADEIALNARVRVRTRDSGVAVGALTRTAPNDLTLTQPDGQKKVIPIEEVIGLEVSRGQASQKTKWALLGVIPWAVVVAVLAADDSDESGIVSAQSALLLGGGVATGLVIGSRKRTDIWEEAAIPGSATGLVSRRDFRVGVRFSF